MKEKINYNETYTIASLMDSFRRGQIRINKDYQRAVVWTKSNKQYLIDSILRGYSINTLRFHKHSDVKWVVDGQQRLTAMWEFYNNKLSLGWKYSKDLMLEIVERAKRDGKKIKFSKNGKPVIKFNDLPDELQDKFRDHQVNVEMLVGYTDEEIRDIFRRLQEGKTLKLGEQLNAYPGEIVTVMRRLANDIPLGEIVEPKDARRRYYEYIAKFMYLEYGLMVENEVKHIGAGYIKDFFRENEHLDVNSDLYKKVKRVLLFLRDSFSDSGVRIESLHVMAFYLFVSHLLDNYVVKGQENNIRKFYVGLRNELEDETKRRSDPELMQFYEDCNKARASNRNLERRLTILLNRYLRRYPLIEKDDNRIFTKDQKRAIFERYGGRCNECGKKLDFNSPNTHYHHKIPYSVGGKTTVENGELLYKECHIKRHKIRR